MATCCYDYLEDTGGPKLALASGSHLLVTRQSLLFYFLQNKPKIVSWNAANRKRKGK
jgi:hypothetical protein